MSGLAKIAVVLELPFCRLVNDTSFRYRLATGSAVPRLPGFLYRWGSIGYNRVVLTEEQGSF